jgi:hypothetical protein
MAADPALVNATNSEPWYRSRVIIGLITSMAGLVLRVAGASGYQGRAPSHP